jgi:hypothetical protein
MKTLMLCLGTGVLVKDAVMIMAEENREYSANKRLWVPYLIVGATSLLVRIT